MDFRTSYLEDSLRDPDTSPLFQPARENLGGPKPRPQDSRSPPPLTLAAAADPSPQRTPSFLNHPNHHPRRTQTPPPPSLLPSSPHQRIRTQLPSAPHSAGTVSSEAGPRRNGHLGRSSRPRFGSQPADLRRSSAGPPISTTTTSSGAATSHHHHHHSHHHLFQIQHRRRHGRIAGRRNSNFHIGSAPAGSVIDFLTARGSPAPPSSSAVAVTSSGGGGHSVRWQEEAWSSSGSVAGSDHEQDEDRSLLRSRSRRRNSRYSIDRKELDAIPAKLLNSGKWPPVQRRLSKSFSDCHLKPPNPRSQNPQTSGPGPMGVVDLSPTFSNSTSSSSTVSPMQPHQQQQQQQQHSSSSSSSSFSRRNRYHQHTLSKSSYGGVFGGPASEASGAMSLVEAEEDEPGPDASNKECDRLGPLPLIPDETPMVDIQISTYPSQSAQVAEDHREKLDSSSLDHYIRTGLVRSATMSLDLQDRSADRPDRVEPPRRHPREQQQQLSKHLHLHHHQRRLGSSSPTTEESGTLRFDLLRHRGARSLTPDPKSLREPAAPSGRFGDGVDSSESGDGEEDETEDGGVSMFWMD